MVLYKDVRVSLVRYEDDKLYNEYNAKHEPSETGTDANESYIEAVTGERFVVPVEITPTFDFKGTPGV